MRHLGIAVLFAAVIGCRGRDEPSQFEIAVSDSVKRASLQSLTVLMDSAGSALDAGNYEEARRLYEAVAGIDSTLAAPWFGLFMARRHLGFAPAADSALDRARDLIVNPIGPHTPTTRD